VVRSEVLASSYRDSVELMRIAEEIKHLDGVRQVGLVMGTPANCAVLREAGLFEGPARDARPNDVVVAVAADDDASADAAIAAAARRLAARPTDAASAGGGSRAFVPTTIAEAVIADPDANLVMISTPGDYATAEALKALKRGLDVFLFSDNVPLVDEIALKALARRKGLLVMGPDCGTAILDGVPLGFANAVRRGRIGLVAASGTGLQEVTCLIDRAGEGVSQAIGVGGRDLDERVGGAMMLAGIERLATDAGTTVLVLLSKPPSPDVAARVLQAAVASGKPVVAGFLGADAAIATSAGALPAVTLEDAARQAVAAARATTDGSGASSARREPTATGETAARTARDLAPGQHRIRGLYSGGTLASEAKVVIRQALGAEALTEHSILDLGDDEYTVGRPHPMIDPSLRNDYIAATAAEPEVAVVLLDVVLGYGAHPDPAGALRPAIEEARATAREAGRDLLFVASVCGTPADPQGMAAQEATLAAGGVHLFPSNAQAAAFAASLARAVSATSTASAAPSAAGVAT
jgi:FdrA protein